MKKIIYAFITMLVISACGPVSNQGEKLNADNANKMSQHEDYKVTKLFTVDGITVYRFYDDGYPRYFTNKGMAIDDSMINIKDDEETEQQVATEAAASCATTN